MFEMILLIYMFTSSFPVSLDKKFLGRRDTSVLLTSEFPASQMEKKNSCDSYFFSLYTLLSF